MVADTCWWKKELRRLITSWGKGSLLSHYLRGVLTPSNNFSGWEWEFWTINSMDDIWNYGWYVFWTPSKSWYFTPVLRCCEGSFCQSIHVHNCAKKWPNFPRIETTVMCLNFLFRHGTVVSSSPHSLELTAHTWKIAAWKMCFLLRRPMFKCELLVSGRVCSLFELESLTSKRTHLISHEDGIQCFHNLLCYKCISVLSQWPFVACHKPCNFKLGKKAAWKFILGQERFKAQNQSWMNLAHSGLNNWKLEMKNQKLTWCKYMDGKEGFSILMLGNTVL